MNRLYIEQWHGKAAGASAPVFLCANTSKTQVFLEGEGQLEVSYDPKVGAHFKKGQVQWLPWPNLTEEFVGPPPTACRVRGQNVTLKIQQFFN